MEEGMGIPVNMGDLPIDSAAMEDDKVYNGELKKITLARKKDKNGKTYCALQIEVVDGDFEGYTVMRNYLPLPIAVTEDMNKAQRIRAQQTSVDFGRFARAFGLKGEMPHVDPFSDDSVANWQEYMDQFIGRTGKFTIENQEFPEGSGRQRPGIRDFVF
jgi:hypothetical protein